MIKSVYPQASWKLVLADRLFFITAILEIVAEYLLIYPVKFILKCVPIFVLIYITLEIKKEQHLHKAKYLVAALVFGAIGDFFLLYVRTLPLFLTGTLSFLISHLFYITLSRIKSTDVLTRSDKEQRNVNLGVGAIWTLTIVNAILMWDKMPNKVGISTYGLVLCTMITLAIVRYKNVPKQSYWLVLFGAALFGISDNVLGMIEFNHIDSPTGYVVIMTTYYASQYLLCYGNIVGLTTFKKQN